MTSRKSQVPRYTGAGRVRKPTIQDALERKVEELTRLLAEEKQTSRRSVAKLQREVARLKSERTYAQRGESREGLMKELEKERMLRGDAEQRLHDMRIESDSCRSRLQALQDEFRKMEEMVRNMLQYKTKLDQLKQEKSNLSVTYETNLLKYRSHVAALERENMMLLNEVKKMESQMSGKGDDKDKTKLLLQRLKMLEAENSALVLENEQQRQQYEKCLDEIANQVVQALLAQKTLREECMKLQGRVQDLELQNRQLNVMFQQRIRFASDSVLQLIPARKLPTRVSGADSSSPGAHTAQQQHTALVHPPSHQQLHPSTPHSTHKCRTASRQQSQGEVTPIFLEDSTESLQSMCSEYMFDDSPGQPQMSSPPPWLRDKLDLLLVEEGSPERSSTSSPANTESGVRDKAASSASNPVQSSTGNPTTPESIVQGNTCASSSPALQTKIETEFPATNSSPKVKHISVFERGCHSLDLSQCTGQLPSVKVGMKSHKKTKTSSRKSPHVNQNKSANQEEEVKKISSQITGVAASQGRLVSSSKIPVSPKWSPLTAANVKSKEYTSVSKIPGPKHSTPQLKQQGASAPDSSPNSSVAARQFADSPKQMLPFRSQYYYDYSDEDSDGRPMCKDFSTASTVSLNELLDSSLDGESHLDDDFLSDWSPICLSPTNQNSVSLAPNGMFYNMAGPKQALPKSVKSGPYADIIVKEENTHVVKDGAIINGCRPSRPDNLILVPREKPFNSCGFSSSSSSSAEEPKPLVLNKMCENFTSTEKSTLAKKDNSVKESNPVCYSNKSCDCIQNSDPSAESPNSKSVEQTVSSLTGALSDITDKNVSQNPGANSNSLTEMATVVASSSPVKSSDKTPPPVPQKPRCLKKCLTSDEKNLTSDKKNQISAEKESPLTDKDSGLIVDSDGLPYLCENLTVEKQKDLAAFLVKDVIERVKNREMVIYHQRCQSSDSSFESVRVERSGSKDDGYSTMSSDIQPEVLKEFSDPVSKTSEEPASCQSVDKISETDASRLAESCIKKTKDILSDLTSDPDSAMENSIHSTEMRNSNQSLSSQVSSSSGDSAVSPGSKVRDMRKYFENEVNKCTGATKPQSMPTLISPRSPKKRNPFFQELISPTPLDHQAMQSAPSFNIDSFSAGSITQGDGSVPATDIVVQMISNSPSTDDSSSDQASLLHISEDKLLEDIPEVDEWEAIHSRTVQESVSMQHPPPPKPSLDQPTQDSKAKMPLLCLSKAKSETDLSHIGNPITTSMYEDFLQGNWDSGKIPERSTSFSEMDIRPTMIDAKGNFYRQQILMDIDETAVLCRVHNIVKQYFENKISSNLDTHSDCDSEKQPVNFVQMWKCKNTPLPFIPPWQPKDTMAALRKSSTPSPVAVKKFDSSNAEDWLLKFSKDEIERHLHGGNLHASSSPDTSQCQDNGDSDLSSVGADVSNCSTAAQDGSLNAQTESVHVSHEEVTSEDSPRSPVEEQTRFNSQFYSLCPADSNRSLFSTGSQDCDINKMAPQKTPDHVVMAMGSTENNIESQEFDEISRQIASLSKTVNDLHRSLSSLNSADSGSTNELQNCLPSANGPVAAPNNVIDGYHWVDDEFYMTSCGGEVIIGSSELLGTAEHSDWMIDYAEENGAKGFCNVPNSSGEIQEEFYEIQVNGASYSNMAGYCCTEENQSEETMVALGNGDRYAYYHRDRHSEVQHFRPPREDTINDSNVEDPEKRANLLDSMMPSGGESNDSLASDIGLDHMMCQRLIGHRRRNEVVRCPVTGRPPLDFSKFFIRFGEPEKQAVAAFNFLEDISTSNSESGSLPRLLNLDDEKDDRRQPPVNTSPPVCIVNCRTSASGRVRKVDKNRRRKRGDARKAQKQRENHSRSSVSRSRREEQQSWHQTSSESPDSPCTGNLSLSDSCCESFSSSSPSVNDLTML